MRDDALRAVPWLAARSGVPQDLQVIAVNTPETAIRAVARRQVRAVLSEVFAGQTLLSVPGQAIRLAGQGGLTGISLSHERGLSLIAIHRSGAVGVDLMRLPTDDDWPAQLALLATDYLGPASAAEIAGLPAARRGREFARAWTQHEACLKCHGLVLQEWRQGLQEKLALCQTRPLTLPDNYVGSIATLKAVENPAV